MEMNSKESMGIAGMSFACLSTRVLEIAIQRIYRTYEELKLMSTQSIKLEGGLGFIVPMRN